MADVRVSDGFLGRREGALTEGPRQGDREVRGWRRGAAGTA